MNVARGFSSYHQNFGTCQTSVLSLQQGGTTCLTLMCTIQASRTDEKRKLALHHLYLLVEQLQEMSKIYNPAKVICSIVKHEMGQLGIDFNELTSAILTPEVLDFSSPTACTRRASSDSSSDSDPASKRRRLNTDFQNTEAGNAPPAELNQSVPLPESITSDLFGVTGRITPVTASFKLSTVSLPDTFSDGLFQTGDRISEPMIDLDIAASSWPMEFLEPSAPLDDLSHDLASGEYLPSWLADNRFLDSVDDGFSFMPDIMECG